MRAAHEQTRLEVRGKNGLPALGRFSLLLLFLLVTSVHEKSEFYTRMRQLRLGYLALQVHSAITIDQQIALRKKYNRDLVKTQEALQRVEASRSVLGRGSYVDEPLTLSCLKE
jgi:hypothetical protein